MSHRDGDAPLTNDGKELKFFGKVAVHILGSFIFIYKVTRVGTCNFEINKSGLLRKSKMGEKTISWENVVKIQLLTEAYLLELEKGAIPLPYRCFKKDERILFEELVANKL